MYKSDKRIERFSQIFVVFLGLLFMMPFAIALSISFTDNATIYEYGYSLFPSKTSTEAYMYILQNSDQVFRALGITIFITAVGTLCGVTITLLLSYPLARKGFPLRRLITFLVLIPILFNAGMVPSYIIYTRVFHIKNTIFALLIPNLLMSPFSVVLFRTYFSTNIPDEIMDAASIDGAGEFRIFLQIALPLAKPIIGTISLMTGIAYWNDWTNGLYYVTDPELFSLQNLLNRMLTDLQFLQSGSAANFLNIPELISKVPNASVRMALACVGIFPVLMIFPFINRAFAKGIAVGSVKG